MLQRAANSMYISLNGCLLPLQQMFGAGISLTVAPMPEGRGGVLRWEVTPIQNTCNQLLTLLKHERPSKHQCYIVQWSHLT